MTIIHKLVVWILILLLLPACTRDRPVPDTVILDEPTADIAAQPNSSDEATGNSSGGATENANPAEQADGQSEVVAPEVIPVTATAVQVEAPQAIEQPTAVVVVPPIQSQNQSQEQAQAQPNQTIQYTVQSGDTLYSIAENYGVSADTVRQMNYLQGDNIQANQVLRIPLLEGYTPLGRPSPTPEPLFHIVASGETLFGIAAQYGVDTTAIIAANNIVNQDGLLVGEQLRIPGYAANVTRVEPTQQIIVVDSSNSTGSPADSISGTPVAPNTVQVEHVVQSGEGLYDIAIRYDVSAVDIASANNILNYELLREGQRLYIPGVVADLVPGLAGQRTHTVQAGEGLYEIAVNYGVDASSIAEANNIANFDLIYPGQRLIIPAE